MNKPDSLHAGAGSQAPCCAPPAGSSLPKPESEPSSASHTTTRSTPDQRDRVALGPASFTMGSDDEWTYPTDAEYLRPGSVDRFSIDVYAVTNLDWAGFVDRTGYASTAERAGSSYVFAGLLADDTPPTPAIAHAPWWRAVTGAAWNHPEGPTSDLHNRWDHPVVHVSWVDAVAYASWAGLRLPAEAEWEFAARAGSDTTFPWGDELEPGGEHRANVFQGDFPTEDTGADGWIGTCPVDAYELNACGLANMIGNVWEWTATQAPGDHRILKGGSYLCHASYCRRYRPAARLALTPDTTAANIGFRRVGR